MAQPAPRTLGRIGQALWKAVVAEYELRPDELPVLEDACRTSDWIATLEDGLVGATLMVKGSQGQQVINPLISELRQYRAARAALLRQLKIPDEGSTDVGAGLSAKNRAAAQARWAKRGKRSA